MDCRTIGQDIIAAFRLKRILFGTFDSSELNHGLNRTCERILMMIWHHGTYAMNELSYDAGLEKGSLTSVIDILEKRGFVSRTRSGTDRRSYLLSATDAGSRLAGRIDTLFITHLEHILAALDEEDRKQFGSAAAIFADCSRKLGS
ncbi:MAG TPA: MarR family transcriptional regulator [Treponemataceae bacterium]|nr:MarR family transcriptional regulator [Treponemataceae bacterium]